MKIMKTIIEKIDKNQKNTDIIREQGRILKEGGLDCFPQRLYMVWEPMH